MVKSPVFFSFWGDALNHSNVVPSRLVIASRESRLAMWQAEHVQQRLSALHPGCEVAILGMTTRGDQILDRPLAKIGGKGLFIKELEVAMQEGRADLAVHSMKDVPMEMPEGFVLAVIPARENPCDAFVSNRYDGLEALPAPGQGALGIEILAGRADAVAAVAPLNDSATAHCVRAERAFSRALGGSCQVPLGAYAVLENNELWLRGFVATPDGLQMVSGELRGTPDDDERLGQQLAARLRSAGADAILQALAACSAAHE